MGPDYDPASKMDETIPPVSPQEATLTIPGSGSEEPPQQLQVANRERYRFYTVVAEGGQGRVLRAKDLQLGRTVALKELHKPGGHTEARFLREARITARLQHPSIVPIYEAGRWPSGEPFYAMKLVSGRSLAQLIDSLHTLGERLAALPHVLAAAEAIAYAHSQRVIHRDLKPANVLVGEFGETVVVDWGLGKELDSPEPTPPDSSTESCTPLNSEHTQPGAVLGTPAYLPPEQAAGKPVDERADVYALGAILYQVLSGHRPYYGRSIQEVLQKALTEEPTPLARLQPRLPEELLAIVSRAMKREPKHRYPTAQQFAEDLRRFLTGQLVGAHQYTGWQLLRRFARQYRAALWVAAVALLALVISGGVDYWRIRHERDVAKEKQEVAENAERRRANAEREATERADSLILLEARNAVARSPEEVPSLLDSLSASFTQWGQARTLAADAASKGLGRRLKNITTSYGNSVQFSPDGRWLLTTLLDHTVRLLDVHTGEGRVFVDHAISVPTRRSDTTSEIPIPLVGSFSPDGKYLVFSSAAGTLKLMELATGSSRDLLRHTLPVTSLGFSADSRSLISAGSDGQIVLWDVASGTSRRLGSSQGRVDELKVLSDGEHLLTMESTDHGRAAWLWNLKDGSSQPLNDVSQHVNTLGVASQTGSFAIGTAHGQVVLWKSASGRKRTLVDGRDSIISVALTQDGRLLAMGNNTVTLWDLEHGTSRIIASSVRTPDTLAFSPDGQWLAIAGGDGQTQLIEVTTGASRLLPKTNEPSQSPIFSPDGNWLALIHSNNHVYLYNMKEGATYSRIVTHYEKDVTTFALTPDGSHVLSASRSDNKVRLSNLTGETLVEELAHRGYMTAAYVVPDGSRLVTAGSDGTVALWSESGQLLQRFSSPAQPIRMLAMNTSGTWIAGIDISGGLWLWDVASKMSRALEPHEEPVHRIAFSPDGHSLASGGERGELKLWDVTSGAGRTVHHHRTRLESLAFSRDGHFLATSSLDGTWLHPLKEGASREVGPTPTRSLLFSADGNTLIWWEFGDQIAQLDLKQAGQPRYLPERSIGTTYMALSPEGRRLASANSDGSIRIWDLNSGESRVLSGHKGPATRVAFSPDGRSLVSSGMDGTVRLWKDDLPLDPDALRAWIHQAANPWPIEPLAHHAPENPHSR